MVDVWETREQADRLMERMMSMVRSEELSPSTNQALGEVGRHMTEGVCLPPTASGCLVRIETRAHTLIVVAPTSWQ
jgi:hypothetical protein